MVQVQQGWVNEVNGIWLPYHYLSNIFAIALPSCLALAVTEELLWVGIQSGLVSNVHPFIPTKSEKVRDISFSTKEGSSVRIFSIQLEACCSREFDSRISFLIQQANVQLCMISPLSIGLQNAESSPISWQNSLTSCCFWDGCGSQTRISSAPTSLADSFRDRGKLLTSLIG